jgi:hypothetical protein
LGLNVNETISSGVLNTSAQLIGIALVTAIGNSGMSLTIAPYLFASCTLLAFVLSWFTDDVDDHVNKQHASTCSQLEWWRRRRISDSLFQQ